MVDNFSKRLLQTLETWEDMKESFSKVLSFFHAQHIRDLYKSSLMIPPLRHLLSTGPPLLAGGRVWGIVEDSLSWLLPREAAIRQTWHLDAFVQGGVCTVNEGAAI